MTEILVIKKRKARIPRALKEQVWIKHNKKRFQVKCPIEWCKNKINCFNWHCGHIIPESKGGPTTIENLKPVCAKCTLSMSNNYTINEFSEKFASHQPTIFERWGTDEKTHW